MKKIKYLVGLLSIVLLFCGCAKKASVVKLQTTMGDIVIELGNYKSFCTK